jgi:hypothetical protein
MSEKDTETSRRIKYIREILNKIKEKWEVTCKGNWYQNMFYYLYKVSSKCTIEIFSIVRGHIFVFHLSQDSH